MRSKEIFPVVRINENNRTQVNDTVVKEFALTIELNGQEVVTLLCSPTDLQFLAIGFLHSQRLIKSKDEIKNIIVDDQGTIDIQTKKRLEIPAKSVITSSGAKGVNSFVAQKTKVESQLKISANQVFSLMDDFERRCSTFKTTGGTHSAAICNACGILVFNEDIGRHNAVDKVFGQCLLQDIDIKDSIVLFSGRVSSEILYKVITGNIPPIFIARNAPTDLGIKLASDLGITLAGFVRGTRMTVYTNDWRIVI